jgi:hypothetical protein
MIMEHIYFIKQRRVVMKRLYYFIAVLVTMITFSLSQPVTVWAQGTASLEVAVGAICRDVVDREPIDPRNSFEASVGKLYCFTKIIGAQNPTAISHIWYFGDTERARINLSVRSSSWRTYSSKRIQSHEVGDWHVDLVGPGGEVLRTLHFTITP